MISPIKATVDITWFDVILSVANDLEPSWMGTSNVTLWQHSTRLEFSSSTLRFGSDVVSAWVTEYWANHCATREHYQPLRSVFSAFSAGCRTTESTELGWNTCILELPYSRKQKRDHVCMEALLTQWFFYILFYKVCNWYVTRINAKITCKTGNNNNNNNNKIYSTSQQF